MSGAVLAIKLGALGDVLQAMGALADLRAAYPDARLVVLTRRPYADLVARAPFVDAVAVDAYRPRWRLDALLGLRRQLLAVCGGIPDRVFDLQNSGRTAFYRATVLRDVWWSGRAGTADCRAPHDNRGGVPALDRLAAQLQAAGIPVSATTRPDLGFLAEPVEDVLRRVGIAPGFVALLPGSSPRGIAKRWPHYADLAHLLRARGQAVASIPGPGEIELCRSIGAPLLTEADGAPLSIPRLAGALRAASVVVANDTGPAHLAAHLGCTGLALFGPHASPARTSIETARFRALAVADLARLDADAVAAALDGLPPVAAPR